MKHYHLILFLILVLLQKGCMDDESWYDMNDLEVKYDTVLNDLISKQSGLFILNEGNFTYDNASLSYYMIDSMKLLNNIFMRTNGIPLGDIAQSMTIRDNFGYIVMNNSSKINVIDVNTFEFVGKITGFTSPRYMHIIDDHKAYVSDLYAGGIHVVDPTALEITGFIEFGGHGNNEMVHHAEQMVANNDELFVNCWSFDSTVLVIDLGTDLVIDTIYVPLQPNSMVRDRFNNIWVLCDGGYEGNPAGYDKPALISIDPISHEIERLIEFELEGHPTELTINGGGDTLYFLNRHVYRHMVLSDSMPKIFLESNYNSAVAGGYYGLGVDPFSGEIYVADAVDQVQPGTVYRLNSDGIKIDSFQTGINPGFFCFRP